MKGIYLSLIAKVSIVLFALAIPLQTDAQTPQANATNTSSYNFWNAEMQAIALTNSTEGSIYLRQDTILQENTLFSIYKNAFGLTQNDEVTLTDSSAIHNNDMKIFKFSHEYKGIKVDDSYILAIMLNNSLYKINYTIQRNLSLNTTPTITEPHAFSIAKDSIGAYIYSWNDSLHNDSIRPIGDLVIYENHLAFTYIIKSSSPLDAIEIYIDAHTGTILKKQSMKMNCHAYNSHLPITTQPQDINISSLNGFLHDNCFDNIHAYYYQPNYTISNTGVCTEIPTSITEIYTDPTQNSTQINHYLQNYLAGYWASKITKEYFKNTFNYDSYGLAGGTSEMNMVFKAKVCGFSSCASPPFFSGGDGKVYFDKNGAWADLDIVGHEWVHNITKRTSSLIYQNESGALNESFSDIFGTVIEIYAKETYDAPNTGDYVIGNGLHAITGSCNMIYPLRSLSNPKAIEFKDPANYNGEYWIPTTTNPSSQNDYGGVHTNSGVQNHWFYLLAHNTGNQTVGTNEFNYTYNITGIGLDKATSIAFCNLSTLVSNATYLDAAENSIICAFQLFGICSQEMNSTVEAWKAVNVLPANSPALTASENIQNINCFNNGSYGSISINSTGGLSPHFYSIDGVNFQTSNTFSNLDAGNYTYYVKDANCNTISNNFTITEPTDLNVNINYQNDASANQTADGSFSLASSGGVSPYQYSIDNGITWQNTPSFNNLGANTYYVKVKDANNCEKEIVVQINEPNSLNISFSTTQVSCSNTADGSISANVTGGTPPYSYLWNNQATQNTATITNIGIGIHYLTITDNNGLIANGQAQLNTIAPITYTIVKTNETGQASNDGSININNVQGGNPPYTYSIDGINFQASNSFSGLSTQSYHITIKDASNCSANELVTLDFEVVHNQSNNICANHNNGSINLNPTNGTPPYTYLWSNGSTSANLSNLSNGQYTVEITDANNNTHTQAFNITSLHSTINASYILESESCTGNDGQIIVSNVTGGSGAPYTYNLNGTTQNHGDFLQLTAGNYPLSIEDNAGCNSTANINLNSLNPVSIWLVSDYLISCNGNQTETITLVTYGQGILSIRLEELNTSTIVYQNTSFNGQAKNIELTEGDYFLTVSDTNGCSYTETFTIAKPSLNVTAALDFDCNNPNASHNIDLTVSGGSSPYTYIWSNGATTQDLNNIPTGNYTVTITDNNYCSITETYTVGGLSANHNITPITCFNANNGAIEVIPQGGTTPYTYEWQYQNNFFSANQQINNLSPGMYFLTITDAAGCTFIDEITITEPPALTISTIDILSQPSCANSADGAISIIASGGTPPYTYSSNGGNTFAPSNTFNNLTPGTYNIVVKDNNYCLSPIQTIQLQNTFANFPTNNIITAQTLSSNTTWTGTKLITGSIIVPNGITLTIQTYGSSIYFEQNAGILVQNGGTLHIDNNVILTSKCPLNTWQGIKNQGNLHITKSKIKNAHIGVEVYASAQSNYIDHTDFIDCNKGISFTAQPNGSSTIQYNLFKSSYIPPATTGGGISIGNISGGSAPNTQPLAFNSLAAQSSGSQWEATNQVGSINLGSKDQDNSYQSGIGIENAYGNIYGNAFIGLETGVYNANQIEQNYFGHCINGIIQNANPLPNGNLRIDRNVFNHTSKATTISTPIFSRIVANSYVNIPKASTPHQCYALKYSTNNYVQIDSNSFYGASYTNNHLKHNTAIIANAATQNNQIQHNTIKGVGMGIKISGHYHNINNNLLQNVRKGIYLTGNVVIENNQFLDIPPALDDNNPNTFDETYGVFAVGQKYRNIRNNQFMGANGSSTNTSNAISAGIVLEQSGSAPVYCTDNSFAKTDVGIQVEGINEQTKIFCNQFATDGIAHHIAGLKLTNDNTNGQITNGKLRHQGTNCDIHTNPAGNEWLNPTGNTDIVIDLNNSNIRPYFLYVAHSIDQNSNPTTVPKHAYGTWNYTGTGSTANKMWTCWSTGNNGDGYQKQATSCDNYQTKSLVIGNTGSTANINDLLTEKAQLEGTLQNAEQNLTDPNYQPNLVAEIQTIHQKLSDIVILLAETYIANNQPTEAKLLLENENYVVAKEKLASIYYQEANYSQSRAVQDDVEYIINHTPSYYYKDIDEQQAQELNAIYSKEIEILQINVAESNRTLSQLHQWELYGLELIRQSGLPISSKAEELLELNQVSSAEHRVEPLDLNSQNFTASLAGVQYDFTLYPNPAINQSLALVPLPEESNGNATLKLINSYQATGGEIASYPLNTGDNSINLNLSNLSSGVYTVVLEVEGIVVASKQLVVIH